MLQKDKIKGVSNFLGERRIRAKTKRRRLYEVENTDTEDRLSDLPEGVLLHILSFLDAKYAVQTCVLSTRWKYLWKLIPTLILHSWEFSTEKRFAIFVSKILTLRDGSTILKALDLDHHGNIEPHLLKKVLNYVCSHNTHLQRLEISVSGDSSRILSCVSSCRALTSLSLSVFPEGLYNFGNILFPKSLNLPTLTSLDLTNFAFCASDNVDRAEPFSVFNNLNSLTIGGCTLRDAPILSISSATLVNFTVCFNSPKYAKIELNTPSLNCFTFRGPPHQRLCGSSLSNVKQVNIDALPWPEHPLILYKWLQDLDGMKSLTVTTSTLQVLSSYDDYFNFQILSTIKCLA